MKWKIHEVIYKYIKIFNGVGNHCHAKWKQSSIQNCVVSSIYYLNVSQTPSSFVTTVLALSQNHNGGKGKEQGPAHGV